MAFDVLERIQSGLVEKRNTVTEFLETASEVEKEICLCEDDHCVQDHLQIISTSLEKLEGHTLGLCEICHGYVEAERLEMDYTASICLDHYSES